MTFLIILGAIILLFVFIALLPIRIRVSYDESLRVYIPILFFEIEVYPNKKKLRSMSAKKYRRLNTSKEKSVKKSLTEADIKNGNTKKSSKLTINTIKPLIGELSSQISIILSKFASHLKVKIYALWVVISSNDAAKTAVTYGAVVSSVSVLMEILEDCCNIKYTNNAKTGVYVDYTLGDCKFGCDVRFTLRFWQIVSLAISAVMAFIKSKIKLEVKNNVRK